jgi:hypothetical protein
MSIGAVTNKSGPYNGDGSTTSFPVTFVFRTSADLVVTETDTATGVDTVKTLATHYTVTGGGNPTAATGTAVAVAAPAAGKQWTITRAPPALQSTAFSDLSAFPGVNVEAAVDLLTMIVQGHDEKLARALLGSASESSLGGVLPAVVGAEGLLPRL